MPDRGGAADKTMDKATDILGRQNDGGRQPQ